MTKEELGNLKTGDIVRHQLYHRAAVVTDGYVSRAIAVMTFDITNPAEWVLVAKADYKIGGP